MYSNDGSTLGASTVAAPAALGIAIWPNLTLAIIGVALALLGILYILYKRRARQD